MDLILCPRADTTISEAYCKAARESGEEECMGCPSNIKTAAEVEAEREQLECIIVGCHGEAVAEAMCAKHYATKESVGRPLGAGGRPRKKNQCEVRGCDKKPTARGLCGTHYHRMKRAEAKGKTFCLNDGGGVTYNIPVGESNPCPFCTRGDFGVICSINKKDCQGFDDEGCYLKKYEQVRVYKTKGE